MMQWIEGEAPLREALAGITGHYTLDTEFMRERTFWPQLALVQIGIPAAAEGEPPLVLLVDPLQSGVHETLRSLFERNDVLAVVHSPSEDWVALRENIGAIPRHTFDTQQAAAMLGMGGGMSYLKLIETTLGVALEKGEQRSDWLRRPLTDSQKIYAAADVSYLLDAYDVLAPQLAAKGYTEWFAQDMAYALEQARTDRLETWPHLSLRGSGLLNIPQQQVLHRLLTWREQRARQNNLPRTWVLANDAALELARAQPQSESDLRRVLEKMPKAPLKIAGMLYTIASTPLPDEADLPDARIYEQRDKQRVKDLQVAVKQVSDRLGFSDGFLASRRWIECWMDTGEWPGLLAGWRRTVLEPVFTGAVAPAADSDS